MQIKFGEKIRELRKRDKRKQEDLAAALGVTNQAVSRWEANGGYPDIEMIPAIANYFHITIDELFGYDSDRQKKLQSYIEKADQMAAELISEPTNTVETLLWKRIPPHIHGRDLLHCWPLYGSMKPYLKTETTGFIIMMYVCSI